METKVCKKCKRELPLSDFYSKKGYKDGHFNICKECHKEYMKDRYRVCSKDAEWKRYHNEYRKQAYRKKVINQHETENSKENNQEDILRNII